MIRLRPAAGALATTLLVAGIGFTGAVVGAAPAQAEPNRADCKIEPGGTLTDFWPKDRLKFDRAWQVTRGKGIRVAVVDSGLNLRQNAQTRGIDAVAGVDVIKAAGFTRSDTVDCYGHGTAVTSILAAQPVTGRDFEGIAPDVTVIPIKQTHKQGDGSGNSENLGAGIDAAIDARAQVINVSITTPAGSPELLAAVKRAAARNIVVVAAAGNDGDRNANRPAYPAAYATEYKNVIAVSASDRNDVVPEFSKSGSYTTVAAPGVDVPVASAVDDKYLSQSGTSFATPYVAGTAALVRAAFPTLSAVGVRNRIVSTADAPPVSVPDAKYGYGIVNPFLAVTSVRSDAAPPPTTATAAPLAAPVAAPPEDRHLQNLALALAFTLLGLVIVALTATVIVTPRRRAVRAG